MKAIVSLREALGSSALLGAALSGSSWHGWRVVLMAAMGEPLLREEMPIYEKLTGRATSPARPVNELAAVVGRRGGKTRALSTMAVYIAALCDHSAVLTSGERGVVLLLAPNQKQSRIALDYCDGIIAASPGLAQFVTGRTADALSLSNGIDIEVRAANFRQLRGVTCVAVLADEAAFFADDSVESANPDTEILNAVRPSLATTNGPLLIASSAYRRTGALWNMHRDYWGSDDPSILCVKGTSREFNPSLSQEVVDRALARDPSAARAEYLAEWRDDLETYIAKETIEACVDVGVHERGPSRRYEYFAFVDAAGGSGSDSMTLCIGHCESDFVVIDALREAIPPFSPDETVSSFSALLKSYWVTEVYGDRFAGEWPRESLRRYGISYKLSELTKSEIYIEALPRLNSRTIKLLDHKRLIAQTAALERRHRTGRDIIDHPPRGHDDVCNSAFGCATLASALKVKPFFGIIDHDGRIILNDPAPERRSWQRTAT